MCCQIMQRHTCDASSSNLKSFQPAHEAVRLEEAKSHQNFVFTHASRVGRVES